MSHSLDLGPEAASNSLLAALRLLERPASTLAPHEHLVPGIFFDFDPEAKISTQVESRPGSLLSAQFTVEGTARWLALHINLSETDLSDKMIIGLACRSMAPGSTTFHPCLRTNGEEGFSDIFFRKTAISYAEPSLHLDALQIESHPELTIPAPQRELVLFFRPETGEIDLQDIRLFTV
jgi:hypothetical protein